MRFIHLYLIGYFVLVVGAVLALYQSGVLARVSGVWLAIGALVALGLGIMLAVTAGKPTRERPPFACLTWPAGYRRDKSASRTPAPLKRCPIPVLYTFVLRT